MILATFTEIALPILILLVFKCFSSLMLVIKYVFIPDYKNIYKAIIPWYDFDVEEC